MNLVNIPTQPTRPIVEKKAESLLAHLNSELKRRVNHHAQQFQSFWSKDTDPDELLEALGPNALLLLASSRENIEHIGRLSSLVGKTILDFLPPNIVSPPREFVLDIVDGAPTGRVTLAPAKYGHDAWNEFIPVSDDPQRTGYDESENPVYGTYSDGSFIMQPLAEGVLGYTDAKEPIYGYDEADEPILTPIVVEEPVIEVPTEVL